MIREDVLTCSSVARPENRNEVKALEKNPVADSFRFLSSSIWQPLLACHPQPWKKSSFRHILLLHTFMCRDWREKKCCPLSSHQLDMTEERISISVPCHYALAVLWGHAKVKCESGEIHTVKTDAIVQPFGKTSPGCARLWSPMAKKDEEVKVEQRSNRRLTVHRVYYKKSVTVDTHFSSCGYTRKKS